MMKKAIRTMSAIGMLSAVGLAFLTTCSTSLSDELNRPELQLIPYPQKTEFQAGTFSPKRNLILTHNEGQKALSQIAKTCAQEQTTGNGINIYRNITRVFK